LFSSLQVDSSKAQNLLGWTPLVTMDEQLAKIADISQNKMTDYLS
jgi:nucleoside-diphosphate-sugar epimerase